MNKIQKYIREILSTPPIEDKCSCGCNSCGDKESTVTESEIGNKEDVEFATDVLIMPYVDKLKNLKTRYERSQDPTSKKFFKDLHDTLLDAITRMDKNNVNNIIDKYPKYFIGLNEDKSLTINKPEFKNFIKEEIRKMLREDAASKLYKIEGLLVTTLKNKTQTQIFSDIRSITGITTMDTEEYIPNMPKKGYKYDRVTIKIDPYPYVKFGQFNIDNINKIIDNINKIRGVVKFVVKDPQLINIGI